MSEEAVKLIKKRTPLRERKKAQPKAVVYFSDDEKDAIRQTVAKGLNDAQTKIFFYTAQALGLNPLLNEIAAITYNNRDGTKTMSIQVMRDGFLTIAHRTGKFAGLESGVITEKVEGKEKILTGWAKVYHRDFTVPVYQEAEFDEYNTSKNLWVTKPKTMIKKVAESMALRKAFNVSGVYAPEELEKEVEVAAPKTIEPPADEKDGELATSAQKKLLKQLKVKYPKELTYGEAKVLIAKFTSNE